MARNAYQAGRAALRALANEPMPYVDEHNYTMAQGCKPWWNGMTCEDIHPHGPIPEGDPIYCPCCHKTGHEKPLKRQLQIEQAREILKRLPPAKFKSKADRQKKRQAKIKAGQNPSQN